MTSRPVLQLYKLKVFMLKITEITKHKKEFLDISSKKKTLFICFGKSVFTFIFEYKKCNSLVEIR